MNIQIKGKIVFVKVVPFSNDFDKDVPEHHRLQIQTLDPIEGYVIHDVKDKEKKFGEKDIGKEQEFSISAFSPKTIYLSLL